MDQLSRTVVVITQATAYRMSPASRARLRCHCCPGIGKAPCATLTALRGTAMLATRLR